jgi:hypothetical protein
VSRKCIQGGFILEIPYRGSGQAFFGEKDNPYASSGADLDALIHSVLFLTPTAICFIVSLIFHVKAKEQ